MKSYKHAKVVVFFGILLLVAMLVYLGTSGKKAEPPKIRAGYLQAAASLPLFVAVEEGFFRDVGLDITLTRFTSSNLMAEAAVAGRIDLLGTCALNVIFNVGEISGERHRVFVLNPYSDREGHVTDHIIVPKGSEIRKLNDLKNKRIGVFPGSVIKIFCEIVLDKHGLNLEDYTLVELLPENWAAVLVAGEVDAVSALEPMASQIIKDGIGESIFQGFYAQVQKDVALSGHAIAHDYYEREPKNSSKIMEVYSRSIKFIRGKPEQAKKYLMKYTGVREDVLPIVNLNPYLVLSEIDVEDVQKFADILAQRKVLHNEVNVSNYLVLK